MVLNKNAFSPSIVVRKYNDFAGALAYFTDEAEAED